MGAAFAEEGWRQPLKWPYTTVVPQYPLRDRLCPLRVEVTEEVATLQDRLRQQGHVLWLLSHGQATP